MSLAKFNKNILKSFLNKKRFHNACLFELFKYLLEFFNLWVDQLCQHIYFIQELKNEKNVKIWFNFIIIFLLFLFLNKDVQTHLK